MSQPDRKDSDQTITVLGKDVAADPAAAHLQKPNPEQPHGASSDSEQKNALAGRTLGAFALLEEVGRGGMGVVYKARHKALDRIVALKILPLAAQLDSNQLRRFRNESRAVAQLSHAHIVPLFDVGEEQDTHFYSMQFIEGVNLSRMIADTRKQVSGTPRRGHSETPPAGHAETVELKASDSGQPAGSVPDNEETGISFSADDFLSAAKLKRMRWNHRLPYNVARIGICVARALQCAHNEGIVHRDVKPSNLMLDPSGKVWVTDFGLAMVRSSPSITQAGMILGTLRYMSPEQAAGRRAFVDHRTDVFSLGITLYELITLQNAFHGSDESDLLRKVMLEKPAPIRKVRPSIPEDLATIVEKAYERNPADRYQSAAELADDLQRFLTNKPILARPANLSRRFRQWCQEHERLATAGFMLIVCLLLISTITGGVIWVAFGEAQRAQQLAEKRLSESEARRMSTLAMLELASNPGRAQALAMLGASSSPEVETQTALLKSYDENHELLLTRGEHPFVRHLALSPDGRFFVEISAESAQSPDARVTLRHAITGAVVNALTNDVPNPTVAFDREGEILIVCKYATADDGTSQTSDLQIWSMPAKEPPVTLDASVRDAGHCGVSSQGDRIAFPDPDGALQVAELPSGRTLFVLDGGDRTFTQAEFSQDNRYILGVASNGEVVVFEGDSGEPFAVIPPPGTRAPEAIAGTPRYARFSADARFVVTSGPEGTRSYEIPPLGDGEIVELLPAGLARPEPRALLSAARNVALIYRQFFSTLNIVDIATGDAVVRIPLDFSPRIAGLLTRGTHCFAVHRNTIFLYSTISGKQVAALKGHTDRITTIATNDATSRMVSADNGGNIRVWSVQSGFERRAAPSHPIFSSKRLLVDTSPQGERRLVGPVTGARTVLLKTDDFDNDDLDADGREFSGRVCRHGIDEPERMISFRQNRLEVVDVATRRVVQAVEPGEDWISLARQLGNTAVLLNTEDGRLHWYHLKEHRLRLLGRTQHSAFDCPLSPDGSQFAYINTDGLAIICSVATGKEQSRVATPYAMRDLDFRPDGESLALACFGNRLEIRNTNGSPAGAPLRPGDKRPTFDKVCYTRDGSILLTWPSGGGMATAWDAETGEILYEQPCPGDTDVALHPTRPIVILFSRYGGAWLWQLKENEFTTLSERRVVDARLAEEDAFLLIEAGPTKPNSIGDAPPGIEKVEAEVLVVDLETQAVAGRKQLTVLPEQLDLSDDARTLAVSSRCFGVSVTDDAKDDQPLFFGNHQRVPVAAGFSGEDNHVVTISPDGKLETRGPGGRLLSVRKHQPGLLISARISSDGRAAATGGTEGTLLVWSLPDSQPPREVSGHSGDVHQLVFNSDGTMLAAASDNEKILLHQADSEEPVAEYDSSCLHMSLSPDGRRLVVVSGEVIRETLRFGGVRTSTHPESLWLINTETGTRQRLEEETTAVSCAFSQDGTEFLVVRHDGSVTVFEADGSLRQTLSSIDEHIQAAAFLQNGKLVVTVAENSTTVWNADDGSRLYQLPRGGSVLSANGADWRPESRTQQEFIMIEDQQSVRWPLDVVDFTAATTRELTTKERSSVELRSGESEDSD